MTVSSRTGAGGGTPSRDPRRFSAADVALIGGGALITALVAAAATRKPLYALALLVVLAVVATVLLGRERLARA
ncbi:MAG TPA: hypothetical protein VMH50_16895, partial [Thermoleophilia bacterium]|nr:hypothetical protein [Thermoleophilia bacterium]